MVQSEQVSGEFQQEHAHLIEKLYENTDLPQVYGEYTGYNLQNKEPVVADNEDTEDTTHEYVEENFCLSDREKDLISRALDKYKGRRKVAAKVLGISERTLYRKIKEYNIS